jgi:hypothetical protein
LPATVVDQRSDLAFNPIKEGAGFLIGGGPTSLRIGRNLRDFFFEECGIREGDFKLL